MVVFRVDITDKTHKHSRGVRARVRSTKARKSPKAFASSDAGHQVLDKLQYPLLKTTNAQDLKCLKTRPYLYSPPYVERIWGMWGSYYTIPKAIFYLLKGDYKTYTLIPKP